LDRLPRWCPVCEATTIVGHGKRFRQAHDDRHERILILRGVCRQCRKTFTVLPDWLVPLGHYSLRCRQQACESVAGGNSAEQAALYCKDPARLPDASTLRRWVRKRVLTVWCWAKTTVAGGYLKPYFGTCSARHAEIVLIAGAPLRYDQAASCMYGLRIPRRELPRWAPGPHLRFRSL
jgi:hypothetical protein